jgi:hypothetical protein
MIVSSDSGRLHIGGIHPVERPKPPIATLIFCLARRVFLCCLPGCWFRSIPLSTAFLLPLLLLLLLVLLLLLILLLLLLTVTSPSSRRISTTRLLLPSSCRPTNDCRAMAMARTHSVAGTSFGGTPAIGLEPCVMPSLNN